MSKLISCTVSIRPSGFCVSSSSSSAAAAAATGVPSCVAVADADAAGAPSCCCFSVCCSAVCCCGCCCCCGASGVSALAVLHVLLSLSVRFPFAFLLRSRTVLVCLACCVRIVKSSVVVGVEVKENVCVPSLRRACGEREVGKKKGREGMCKPSVMLRLLGIARDQTVLRMFGGTPCHQSLRSLSYLRPCLCSMAPSSTPFVSDSRQNGSDSRSLSSRRARSSSIDAIFTVDEGRMQWSV